MLSGREINMSPRLLKSDVLAAPIPAIRSSMLSLWLISTSLLLTSFFCMISIDLPICSPDMSARALSRACACSFLFPTLPSTSTTEGPLAVVPTPVSIPSTPTVLIFCSTRATWRERTDGTAAPCSGSRTWSTSAARPARSACRRRRDSARRTTAAKRSCSGSGGNGNSIDSICSEFTCGCPARLLKVSIVSFLEFRVPIEESGP